MIVTTAFKCVRQKKLRAPLRILMLVADFPDGNENNAEEEEFEYLEYACV